MKLIKKIFYTIAILIILCCAGILIIALSPELTQSLSLMLYGEEGPDAYRKRRPVVIEDSGYTEDIFGDTSGIAAGVLASEEGAGYVAPVRGALNLPAQVIGKSGYEPVSGRGEELADEQADELGEQIEAGETGDGLIFDAVMYPYYNMLNSKMQHIYRQIYANAEALKESFAPVEEVNTAQLKNVFEAVCNDHPELFWLDTAYSCKYRSGGRVVEMTLSFNRTAKNLEQYKAEFFTQAKKIVDGVKPDSDLVSKETYVHDALIKKADYDILAPMNQSAYSALVSGDTVCAGYARAFQYLMQLLDVPCYYCTGYSGEDHAWNIIRLEDGFYNVDATWDDTKPPTYDYFNKTDADYVGTHVRTGLSVYLPPCGSGFSTGSRDVAQYGSDRPGGIELNPNPQQPLVWVPKEDMTGITISGNDIYDLNKAGISADSVLYSLEGYYADCLRQVEKAGSGQKSFVNIVPRSVLDLVEQSYGTGAYQKGYVEESLKKIGMQYFAIQIQVENLGGNYYRLYHNIYTWKETD